MPVRDVCNEPAQGAELELHTASVYVPQLLPSHCAIQFYNFQIKANIDNAVNKSLQHGPPATR